MPLVERDRDDSPPTCPDEAFWQDLRESPRDELPPSFLLHLRGCHACSARLAALATEWSRAELVADWHVDPRAGSEPIVEHLAGTAPPPAVPQPPPSIAGLADLVEAGRGGMGIVYRARDARLGRTVAVKVLSAAAALAPEARARTDREARVLARIVHPNIVRILSVVDVAGVPAIVMEWIDGPSLAKRAREGPIALRDVVELVRDLARAVAAVHATGVVHRDIKPANVLLTASAGQGLGVPKLVDFGLARHDDEAGQTVTRASVTVGTPAFMAPEQTGLDPALGDVGPATDIHALGALLYWLLAGKAPYDGPTTAASLRRAAEADATPISVLVPRLPVDVGTIVARCLERQPGHRYRSAEALADDLSRFLDGRPILARRAGLAERGLKWARRRPGGAALLASATLVGLGIVAGVAHHVRSLALANRAMVAKRDEAIASAALARQSFERLTDSSAERFLARGNALEEADRDHLRELRDRYRDWPLEPDVEAALHFRAAGLFRLATLFDALRWKEDAVETGREYDACLDELERRGIATADETSRRYLLLRLGRAFLAASGRLDEAIAATRDTVASLEARTASERGLERHLAVARADLGNLEGKAGRLAEGRAEQERAVAMFERLVAESPLDAELSQISLTVLYNAAINPAFGDDPAARRGLLTALVARATAGLERFPAEPAEFGRGLLLGLTILADADLREGNPTEALEKVVRRAATARRLAEGSPHRQRFLDEVIGAAGQAFECLRALGRPGDAERDLDEADRLATEAADDEPAVFQRSWVLVQALLAKSAMFQATGRPGEAIAVDRRLLATMRPWVKDDGSPEPFPVTVAGVEAEIERLEAAERAGATVP